MSRGIFVKGLNGALVPVDEDAVQLVGALKVGSGVSVEVKGSRNVGYHRKFFALLRLAFDAWEPADPVLWKGEALAKNFESFRRDILILAGHHDAHYGVDGSVTLVARSVSFARCDEQEFDKIYRSVLDVVWDRVLRDGGYRSTQEVENVVAELLSFA